MLTSVRSLLAATALAGAFAATPALADDEPTPDFTVTGNVTGVTDYRFRGVGLSGGDMAIQGAQPLRFNAYKVPMMRNLVKRAIRGVEEWTTS